MKDYLSLIAAVVLLSLSFVIQKIYQKIKGDSTGSSAEFSIISGVFGMLFLLFTNGFSISFTLFSFLCTVGRAFCGLAYTVLGFRIMKEGQVAVYMLFLMSGGMLVPAVYGWIFLHEAPGLLPVFGVVLILLSMVLNAIGGKRPTVHVLVMCLAVFFLNGLVSVISKVHQINTAYAAVPTVDFAMLSSATSIGMSLLLRIGAPVREKKRETAAGRHILLPLLLVIAYSVLGTVSSVLQLEGAKTVPASVLYPIITGGTVALTGIFAAWFFKEKLSGYGIASVILCCIGTCLFL